MDFRIDHGTVPEGGVFRHFFCGQAGGAPLKKTQKSDIINFQGLKVGAFWLEGGDDWINASKRIRIVSTGCSITPHTGMRTISIIAEL